MLPILAVPITSYVLYKIFKKDNSYKPQEGSVSSYFIEQIVLHTIIKGQDFYLKLTDEFYSVFTLEDIKRFVNEYSQALPYMPDIYDCDNIANHAYAMAEMKMPGCSFGFLQCTVPDGQHMVNFFIDEKGTLWIVDLGSKEIYKPNDLEISFVYI